MAELSKAYDPKAVEKSIYERWEQAGAFNAEPGEGRGSFCIVIPPPNVTAPLHVGHALNNALQDVLIRFQRMRGRNTLWMPGTDHAGIATQTVVEKRILAEEGRRRTDFERSEFVERVQAWKDEYEARILDQLQMMGCSCDWRRTRFTMDETCARAVRATFFRLFEHGLVYRGKRLVNWDPATQTVLADDEVEHEEIHGHFWYLRYPLAEPVEVGGERIEHVTVATTRPETMLGDTAVAMNPGDPRAEGLLGRQVRLPLVGRMIPIIADDHVVLPDPESEDEKARFSTGFLKVTPAHDPDDWAIGQRHDLAIVNVMAPDGTISDRHGWDDAAGSDAEQFLGMDRFEAREAIVEWFRKENLLAEVREYTHPVGHSYRSHVPIEPYLSDQWYIAVKKPIPDCESRLARDPLAKAGLLETRDGVDFIQGTDVPVNSLAGLALAPLLDGRLAFTPDRYTRTYQTWLENLRDWPISRQLWWGHRIPIWSLDLELPKNVAPEPSDRGPDAQVCAALDAAVGGRWNQQLQARGAYVLRVEGHPEKAGWIRAYVCTAPGSEGIEEKIEAAGFRRDADVLDTWFSSALWPFSTMGWPEKTPELQTWYPGDVLCTAREIITLWVSRMVMMGQYCAGDIPFSQVFIHAMIQDGEGRKMSKSLGNGIDPLDIVDSHGADAMRFTLISMTTQTQDVRMPVEQLTLPDGRKANTSPKFDIGRNFCNKLWNASRFVLMNLEGAPAWDQIRPHGNLADAWILSRLNTCARAATEAVEGFRFSELADVLYHFTWDDFCDWYVEIAKARIADGDDTPKAVLAHCLDSILRLLHPLIPFITEAIWARLNEVARVRGPGDEPAEDLLIGARWPQCDAAAIQPSAEADFDVLRDLIRQIRDARRQHNVPPGRRVDAIVEITSPEAEMLEHNVELLRSQAQLGEVSVRHESAEPAGSAAAVSVAGARVFVLDIVDPEAERARLTKQRDTLTRGIRGIEGKLSNEGFLKKAPPELVESERNRLQTLTAELAAVEESLEALA